MYTDYNTLTTTSSSDGVIAAMLALFSAYIFIILAIAVVAIVFQWKVYKKAGRNGWEAIIPIYSQWVGFEIVGMKGWYVLLGLIPFVGAFILGILSIIQVVKLAQCFKKESGFIIGLILLPLIFMGILAFDKSVYTKPVEAPKTV